MVDSSHVLFSTDVPSPIGSLHLLARGGALVGLTFDDHAHPPIERGEPSPDAPPFAKVRDQLAAYFDGRRTAFDLPLAFEGTAFQRAVWRALHTIPHGEAVSYAEIARRIGRPASARAVGAANGRNPISIVVPCHRVISSSGALIGYAGGLDRKRWLLEHEGTLQGRMATPLLAS